MDANLSGKSFVVTGATSGIGLAAAEILIQQGAWVIGVGRSAERCRAAEQRIRQIDTQARVNYLVSDLAQQSEVRTLAEQIGMLLAADGQGQLNGLLNNAGTFTYWLTLTPEGFETQWAVNHLAPFLLTRALLPCLQAAPNGRVVTVSSDSHFAGRLHWEDIQMIRHYNGLRAYEQSKLANVLFTHELNRRLSAGSSMRAFAADPGLVKTDIGLKGTPAVIQRIWRLRRAGGISPEQSAGDIVHLLTAQEVRDSSAIYWKNGKPARPSPRALDSAAASRLWSLSAQMCGLE